MKCETCGRPVENGQRTHWLGCDEVTTQHFEAGQVALDPDVICEHDGCSEPKKEWAGKGAKPKYCAAGHKKEK